MLHTSQTGGGVLIFSGHTLEGRRSITRDTDSALYAGAYPHDQHDHQALRISPSNVFKNMLRRKRGGGTNFDPFCVVSQTLKLGLTYFEWVLKLVPYF